MKANFPSVRQLLTDNVQTKKVSGCCAAVYEKGKLVFENYAGRINDRRETGASSAFRLASMTKPITATAVLLCAEAGLLDLNDPVCKFLPEFSELYIAKKTADGFEKGERANAPTVFNLLTHTSGIGTGEAGDWQYDRLKARAGETLKDAVSRYGMGLLAFRPGSAQFYSPVCGFDVAARIVEVVSGMRYDEFLRERIFKPLGIEHISYRLTEFEHDDIAYATISENGTLTGAEVTSNFEDFPENYTGGGAGLIATLTEYGKFACELWRCYKGEGKLLKSETVRNMGTPQLDEKKIEGVFDLFNWGLGVRVVQRQCTEQPLSPGSFGWSGAYGTHFWIDPEKDIVAIYMHNSKTYGGAGAPHTYDFERAVMKDL